MNNLRTIRGKMRLTQGEFCQLIGVSRPTLIAYENDLPISAAEKIAEKLNINVFELLGDNVLKKEPSNAEEKQTVLNSVESIKVE